MTDAAPQLSSASDAQTVHAKWGWFIALGIGFLIAGGIASVNLFAATLASILYIGAMMFVAAIMALVHAVTISGWQRKLLRVVAAIVYGIAGAIVLYDPLLASLSFSLALGITLCVAGILRISAGIHDRHMKGAAWVIAAGVFTIIVGIIVIAAWPGISLWLLGAILTVDLIVQGWSFIAFGLALKTHAADPRAMTGAPAMR